MMCVLSVICISILYHIFLLIIYNSIHYTQYGKITQQPFCQSSSKLGYRCLSTLAESLEKSTKAWFRTPSVRLQCLHTLPFAYSPGATCCCHPFHCSSAQQMTPSSAILKISKEHIQTIRSMCSCCTRKLSWARATLTGWVWEWRMFLHKTIMVQR